GGNQSQLHHWYETLTAGQQLRIWSKLLQQGDGFVERSWREVLKAPRYHRASPFLHRNRSFVQAERVNCGKGTIIRGSCVNVNMDQTSHKKAPKARNTDSPVPVQNSFCAFCAFLWLSWSRGGE